MRNYKQRLHHLSIRACVHSNQTFFPKYFPRISTTQTNEDCGWNCRHRFLIAAATPGDESAAYDASREGFISDAVVGYWEFSACTPVTSKPGMSIAETSIPTELGLFNLTRWSDVIFTSAIWEDQVATASAASRVAALMGSNFSCETSHGIDCECAWEGFC